MELLAPAGNQEKLKYAVAYGADAVYFGLDFGSLRNFAGNFSLVQAATALTYLHDHGKRGYVALNIYPHSDEFNRIAQYAGALDEMGVDAFIVSDLGVLTLLKNLPVKAALHISTQANTTNYQSALAYRTLGAQRINLARELSLAQVEAIALKTKGDIETEVFVHGAVCFSYSGRCAISDYLTGHSANRGECKHPCRWKYTLMEETRPGKYFPVVEDDRGLYLFNCNDLALFEYVPRLREMGITSIKIEGRMKSIHYIATVVSFYRKILDGHDVSIEEGIGLLGRTAHRGFSTGFMKGGVDQNDYQYDRSVSSGHSTIVGNVTEEKKNGAAVLEVRNTILAGEKLEVLHTDGTLTSRVLPCPLTTTRGEKVDRANHSQSVILEQDLPPFTILRRLDSSVARP